MIQNEAVLGGSQVTFRDINTIMGPTFPPRVIGNLVLLSYEGISFVFQYKEELPPMASDQ